MINLGEKQSAYPVHVELELKTRTCLLQVCNVRG